MALQCGFTDIDGINKIVGVEKAQQTSPTGRPYILANPGLKDLPIVGTGFPAEPDAEMIVAAKPDVIFAGDIVNKSGIEQLQAKTGIPVISLKKLLCAARLVVPDQIRPGDEIILGCFN